MKWCMFILKFISRLFLTFYLLFLSTYIFGKTIFIPIIVFLSVPNAGIACVTHRRSRRPPISIHLSTTFRAVLDAVFRPIFVSGPPKASCYFTLFPATAMEFTVTVPVHSQNRFFPPRPPPNMWFVIYSIRGTRFGASCRSPARVFVDDGPDVDDKRQTVAYVTGVGLKISDDHRMYLGVVSRAYNNHDEREERIRNQKYLDKNSWWTFFINQGTEISR